MMMISIGVRWGRFPRMRSWIMFMNASARYRPRSAAVGGFEVGSLAGMCSAGAVPMAKIPMATVPRESVPPLRCQLQR